MPGARLLAITGRAIGMAQLIIAWSHRMVVDVGFQSRPAALGLRSVFRHLIAQAAHGEDRRAGLLARHALTL